MRRRIPIPSRLRTINNPPHLLPLLVGELNIPRRPVPLQPLRLGRARNSNHALSGDPRKRDLRN